MCMQVYALEGGYNGTKSITQSVISHNDLTETIHLCSELADIPESERDQVNAHF